MVSLNQEYLHSWIREIDAQHEELLERTGRLLELVRTGQDLSCWQDEYESLQDFLKQHFSLEEELMRRTGYPERLGHTELHRACARDMLWLEQAMRRGLVPRFSELKDCLQTWIHDHLTHQDEHFERFLEGLGLNPVLRKPGDNHLVNGMQEA